LTTFAIVSFAGFFWDLVKTTLAKMTLKGKEKELDKGHFISKLVLDDIGSESLV